MTTTDAPIDASQPSDSLLFSNEPTDQPNLLSRGQHRDVGDRPAERVGRICPICGAKRQVNGVACRQCGKPVSEWAASIGNRATAATAESPIGGTPDSLIHNYRTPPSNLRPEAVAPHRAYAHDIGGTNGHTEETPVGMADTSLIQGHQEQIYPAPLASEQFVPPLPPISADARPTPPVGSNTDQAGANGRNPGNWTPPTVATHPEGWYLASDGNWYPPQQPAIYDPVRKMTARKLAVIGVVVLALGGLGLGGVLMNRASSQPSVMSAAQLDTALTTSGPWSDGSTATTADCVAGPSVSSRGVGQYICDITFDDGTTVSKTVTVDATGNWVTSNS